MQNPFTHDVLIAGAGPVGLFLAAELGLAGLSVLVLERELEPSSALKHAPFGLRGLSIPTLEAFYRRGLLDEVAAGRATKDGKTGDDQGKISVPHWMSQRRRPAGHFAGIQFHADQVDTSKWEYWLPGPAGTVMAVEMAHLETVLVARAQAVGVEIRRGFGVEDFDQDEHGVTVRAGGADFFARWLVGCDGGRSTVRKAGGFGFSGTDAEFTGYSIQVDITGPHALRPGRHYTPTGMYTYTPPGTIAMVHFDGGSFHRTSPIAIGHVQDVLRHVTGTDVTLSALHLAATWSDRACQADAYRKGRVLLAGDAAHIHSTLGGQGLNLGLGDAMNLGWKLVAVCRGDAPPGMLETYFSERHPSGASILAWSRAQVALMRPTPSSRALEAIVRDLIATDDGASYFASRVWGVSRHYELGSGDDDGDGDGNVHRLAGRSVPDFSFIDGTTPGQLLRSAKGLFLDFDAMPQRRALAARWHDRVDYVAGDVKDRLGLSAVIVRPDGIVAWAAGSAGQSVAGAVAESGSEPAIEPDNEAAMQSATDHGPGSIGEITQAFSALSRWFGKPTGP